MAEKERGGLPRPQAVQAMDVPVSNPEGVRSVYANDVGVAFTVTDARLIFCEIAPAMVGGTKGAAEKILKANVVIPLQQAAAIAQYLTAALIQHAKDMKDLEAASAKPQQSPKV